MAEKANKFINSEDDDDENDETEIEVQHIDPYEGKVKLYTMGSLDTPAPPPVPGKMESLSVRIAVNGKDYGPYERATLMEMISNGSLTSDTLVFMAGMSQWAPASSVPEVNELFGKNEPAPLAPPVPWASSKSIPVPPAAPASKDDYGLGSELSPKMRALVTSAIADGEISDLERQVLIRNAQAEGLALDELAVIVDAMLFQQRQLLQQQKERHEQEINLAKVQTEQASRPELSKSGRQQVRKCPSCGTIFNEVSTGCCPECGYELEIREVFNPIQPLIDKLEAIDREYSKINPIKQSFAYPSICQRKTNVISMFKVPLTCTAIADFLAFAATAHKSCPFGDPVKKTWKNKVEEVIASARVKFPDDKKLSTVILETANKVGLKIK